MKNVLTRNFVIVPVSLGLLLLPQASVEEPQSPSVLKSLLPAPNIHPSIRPSVCPSYSFQSAKEERESEEAAQDSKRILGREAGAYF